MDQTAQPNNQQPAYKRIAHALLSDLKQLHGCGMTSMPTAADFAHRHGVGRNTVLKALRLLQDEGILQLRRKRGIIYPFQRPVSPASRKPPERTAAEKLFEELAADIQKGRLRTGDLLPKTAYLVKTHKVSYTTINRAFEQLMRKGLAHKQGRRFLVGPKKSRNADALPPKAVLLIQYHEDTWRRLAQSEFASPFLSAFTQEAKKSELRLISYVMKDISGKRVTLRDHECLHAILRGSPVRMSGIALLGFSSAKSMLSALGDYLSAYAMPIVWLNADNESCPKFKQPGIFINCHIDERAGLRLALEKLFEFGHTRIGAPFQKSIPWMHHRAELAVREAARIDSRLRVIPKCNATQFWSDGIHEDETPADKLHRLSNSGVKHVREFIRDLLKSHPGMLVDPLLRQPKFYSSRLAPITHNERFILWNTQALVYLLKEENVTALLSPCDHFARGYMQWLALAGIDVPREVSLISFNNFIQFSTSPFSTIDWGMECIGYAAFHAMINDIPVRMRNGAITGEVSFIDRNSIANQKNGRVQADLTGETF